MKTFVAVHDDECRDILTLLKDDYAPRQIAYYKETPTVDISGTNEEMKEGDYIYVSDESEEVALKGEGKRILLRKCNNGVVCISVGTEKNFLNGNTFETTIWKYAVPIPKTKTITLKVTEEQEREINKLLKL